jgi:site-specific DNA-methyltransferase (adenine-specific)
MFNENGVWLMQGDCLERMKEIPSGSVDMILTDPPYGTTQCKWDSIIPLDLMWENLKRIIKPDGAIVITAAQPFTSVLVMSNIKQFKYQWVWEKNLKTGNLNAKRMPMCGHEDVVVFCAKSPTYNPQKRKRTTEVRSGNKRNSKTEVYGKQREFYVDNQSDWIAPDTVLNGIPCVHSSEGRIHPNQKPVELMKYLIKTYTNEGETVLDFTMGSGTTGVAAVNASRKFIGIELDDGFFSIATNRIEKAG